jgi:hypothetical protein
VTARRKSTKVSLPTLRYNLALEGLDRRIKSHQDTFIILRDLELAATYWINTIEDNFFIRNDVSSRKRSVVLRTNPRRKRTMRIGDQPADPRLKEKRPTSRPVYDVEKRPVSVPANCVDEPARRLERLLKSAVPGCEGLEDAFVEIGRHINFYKNRAGGIEKYLMASVERRLVDRFRSELARVTGAPESDHETAERDRDDHDSFRYMVGSMRDCGRARPILEFVWESSHHRATLTEIAVKFYGLANCRSDRERKAVLLTARRMCERIRQKLAGPEHQFSMLIAGSAARLIRKSAPSQVPATQARKAEDVA